MRQNLLCCRSVFREGKYQLQPKKLKPKFKYKLTCHKAGYFRVKYRCFGKSRLIHRRYEEVKFVGNALADSISVTRQKPQSSNLFRGIKLEFELFSLICITCIIFIIIKISELSVSFTWCGPEGFRLFLRSRKSWSSRFWSQHTGKENWDLGWIIKTLMLGQI